jgi:hypothetical protein
MAQTLISGKQVKDSSIQRVDLDVSTVGQAVVAKLVQGSNITLSSTGADSGTGDVTVSAAAGINAFTTTAVSSFTVPAVGATTTVNVVDASWIVVGQLLYFDTAGGGPGLGGILQVTAKTGNQLTVKNLYS